MEQKNIVSTLVSIPCRYGLRGPGKPMFPKMRIYGWTLPETESRLDNLISGSFDHVYRERTTIQDLGGADIREANRIFIVIEGVVHGFCSDEDNGVSWNAWVAFLSRDNAERYVKEREERCHDVFDWVFPCSKA
jgi:hypothetical protein